MPLLLAIQVESIQACFAEVDKDLLPIAHWRVGGIAVFGKHAAILFFREVCIDDLVKDLLARFPIKTHQVQLERFQIAGLCTR